MNGAADAGSQDTGRDLAAPAKWRRRWHVSEKLDALKKAWDVEARINLALPMDDRTAVGDAGDSRNRYGGAG
jgi:hypothetical protein